MCRVFIGTKNAIMRYNRLHNLTSLLHYLVNNCGGHGNGIALIKDKTIIYTKKGVDYTYKQAARALLLRDYDYALFHTRIASVSTISDENCHPFTYQKRYALIMNGTINNLSALAEAIGITDTETIFNVIKGLDIDTTIKALSTLSPVFIGVAEGLPYVLKNSGALEKWKHKSLKPDDYLFASVFPKEVKGVHPLPYDFTWKNGEEIVTKTKSIQFNHYTWSDISNFSTYESIGGGNNNKTDEYEDGFEDGYYTGYNDALSENLIN